MKLSVVIPAFNESKHITACVQSVQSALKEVAGGVESEIIVTDNASTDDTAERARDAGARVVFEPFQQIARSRNAGAAVATGDWLLFVDADSVLHPESLREMLERIEKGGVVGGGCLIALDSPPLIARVALMMWSFVSVVMRWAAGSFVFCRADAFFDVGGFSEELFAGEELALSRSLKSWAKKRGLVFVILRRQAHVSSARKFHLYSLREICSLILRTAIRPRKTLRSREGLDMFYDARR